MRSSRSRGTEPIFGRLAPRPFAALSRLAKAAPVASVLLALALTAGTPRAEGAGHAQPAELSGPRVAKVAAAVDKTARENGCASCHESAPGELSRAVVDWKKSVHAENGVTCDACHGGDPAVRGAPDDRSAIDAAHFSSEGFVHRPRPATKISYFCGRCHAAIKEKHLGSPHGENVHPTCLYCHGHHAIRSPDTKIIDVARCTVCHDFRNAGQIRKLLEQTETNIAKLQEDKEWLESHEYRSLSLDEIQHHSRASMTQLRIAFHSFNLSEVMNFSSQLKAALHQAEHTREIVEKKESARRLQTRLGIGIAIFLVVFAVSLMRYKKTFLGH